MENRLYFQDLACYANANPSTVRTIGKMDYIDLSLLPNKTMREEYRAYFLYRGKVQFTRDYTG